MGAVIGVYARISFDEEGEGLGVQRQIADSHALAAARGWSVARDYVDNNVSAYKPGVIRPEFLRLLADLRSGKLEGFVAYDPDRIARQPGDLERLIEVYDKNPKLVMATRLGDLDLSTTDGRFMARLMVNFANKASADTARRVKRKILENAENGKPHGGPRPYGYSLDMMKTDPDEAPIVRRMGLQFISGFSYREIAWRLNEEGILTRVGSPWYADTIKKFLTRPRNGGFRVVDGVRYPGKWEPIFTPDEWDQIERMIKRRKAEAVGRPSNRRYLLTGILRCGKCGGFMYGMTKRPGPNRPLQPTYQCRKWTDVARLSEQCGGMVIQADPLHHFLRELICARLDTPELLEALTDQSDDAGELQALLRRQTGYIERRIELRDAWAAGDIALVDFRPMVAAIERHLEDVDRQITLLRRSKLRLDLNAGETVCEAWDRNPDGWRREVLEVLVGDITVASSTSKPYYEVNGTRYRFDPERVTIAWKV